MTTVEPRVLTQPAGGVPDITDTRAQFQEIVQRFEQAQGPVAVDAERAMGYRYSNKDYVIQLKRNGAGIALLDPIALGEQQADFSQLREACAQVDWIFHDARQDIPGVVALGLVPDKIFDTEIAARLLGNRRFGLAAVTERYLGVVLAKEHAASDWSYRPIPRDWRNYAALDVEILIELRHELYEALYSAGKITWAQQEFAYVLEQSMQPKAAHPEPWRRVSHISDLRSDGRGLAIVRELWYERDKWARQLDIEPTLLLTDAAIMEAAKRKPHNAKQFAAIRILNERVTARAQSTEQERMFERYIPIQRKVQPKVWKAAIERALALPYHELPIEQVSGANDIPQPPKSLKIWREHHPERFARLERVRQVLAQIAEDTQTPVDMLVQPKLIKALCWQDIDAAHVREFLTEYGARPWQVNLVSKSVSGVIM